LVSSEAKSITFKKDNIYCKIGFENATSPFLNTIVALMM
jgi:hypothetical protein